MIYYIMSSKKKGHRSESLGTKSLHAKDFFNCCFIMAKIKIDLCLYQSLKCKLSYSDFINNVHIHHLTISQWA